MFGEKSVLSRCSWLFGENCTSERMEKTFMYHADANLVDICIRHMERNVSIVSSFRLSTVTRLRLVIAGGINSDFSKKRVFPPDDTFVNGDAVVAASVAQGVYGALLAMPNILCTFQSQCAPLQTTQWLGLSNYIANVSKTYLSKNRYVLISSLQ